MSDDCPRCRRRDRRRKQRTTETRDVRGQLLRSVVALGKRVAEGDPEDLWLLLELRAAVDEAEAAGVAGLRAQGHSDSELAQVAGLKSRQAARARWPRPTAARRAIVVDLSDEN